MKVVSLFQIFDKSRCLSMPSPFSLTGNIISINGNIRRKVDRYPEMACGQERIKRMDNDESKRIITFIVVVVISTAFVLGFGSEEGGGETEAIVTV